jgi:hypothetical protein
VDLLRLLSVSLRITLRESPPPFRPSRILPWTFAAMRISIESAIVVNPSEGAVESAAYPDEVRHDLQLRLIGANFRHAGPNRLDHSLAGRRIEHRVSPIPFALMRPIGATP